MTQILLEVAPQFDDVTVYSLRWSQRLHEELGEKHVSCLREDAVRDNFKDYVKEYDPKLITFYDHGNETSLIGNDMKPLLDSRNADLLNGREMYTMCCLAAKKLGPEAYRKGCKAWWGYTKVFSFVTTDEEMFGRLGNMGLILRRKEHLSWEDCVSRVTDAYNEEIGKGGGPWTIISLINNRDALICYTDANQPPSDCAFRRLGIRIFGTAGQKLSKSVVIAMIVYYSSWGFGVYSICQLKGHHAVLEGVYTALALMFLTPIIVLKEYVKWLGKS